MERGTAEDGAGRSAAEVRARREPVTGKPDSAAPAACLNCGERLAGPFCAACGQRGESPRRPFFSLLGEFFSEFFAWDGRLARTAGALWRPARLTQHYLEGKRASYVSPFRIYLVTSLAFFFVVGFDSPNAEDFNVYVDDVLIGREAPEPGLNRLRIMEIKESSVGSSWLRSRVLAKRDALQKLPAQELLDRLVAGAERTLPTALICFVPLLALALKLLYIRRGTLYVDHLVFALHFQSFLFVLFVGARIANALGVNGSLPSWLTYLAMLFLIAPIFVVIALRRLHSQAWLLSILKGAALCVLYFLLLGPVLAFTFLAVMQSM